MVVADSLIFRSDSNGEDLEGYAGAGLYESITMDTTQVRALFVITSSNALPMYVPSLYTPTFNSGTPLYL